MPSFKTYYTPAPMRAKNFLMALTMSDRSDGKTFSIKEETIADWRENKWIGVYVRRWKTEIPETLYTTFYNEVQEKYPEKYGDLKFRYNKNGVKVWDAEAEEWSQILYFVPLTMAAKLKSTLDVNPIHKVFFDEYIPLDGRYIKDEMTVLLEFWKSIDRDRDQTLIHCYGNKMDLFNPFFDYFGIPVFDQEKKKIRSYKGGTVGVEIYYNAEHRAARKEQRSAQLFAGTEYDAYAQGGTLTTYDLRQGKVDPAAMHYLFSFKTVTGAGAVWENDEGTWIVSQSNIRLEGSLIVDKMCTLPPGDRRKIYSIRLPAFARLIRQNVHINNIAYESPAAFHAIEPLLKRACAL